MLARALHHYRVGSRTWVGLTQIWGVPGLVGCCCRYLLPKEEVGTFQIYINPTQVREQMRHTVVGNNRY